LRHRFNHVEPKAGGVSGESFNRVESSYQLNEKLSGGGAGRFLKAMLNNLLNATRMGDSLKIHAEKK
jgi:hypothetical protein